MNAISDRQLKQNNGYKSGKGFTLTEVLVTLAIIGVVAALTIPALITNIQQQQYHTAFKKYYAEISQAFNLIKEDHGGTLENLYPTCGGSDYCTSFSLADDLGKHISYVKFCGKDDFSICYNGIAPNSAIKLLNNNGYVDDWRLNNGVFVLNSGAALIFLYAGNSGQACNTGVIQVCGGMGEDWIFIDVNGYKEPNTLGMDVYSAYITKYGLKLMGSDGSPEDWGICELNNAAANNYGYTCGLNVITGKDY